MYLIAVFGRATTQALQTIRTYRRDRFNEWWPPKAAFMSSDPLLMFFNRVRNAFLKEGGMTHSGGTLVGFGSRISRRRYDWDWYIPGAPTEHDGKPIPVTGPHGPTIETLGQLYVAFLDRLVSEAVEEFKWRPIPPPWLLPGPKPLLRGG